MAGDSASLQPPWLERWLGGWPASPQPEHPAAAKGKHPAAKAAQAMNPDTAGRYPSGQKKEPKAAAAGWRPGGSTWPGRWVSQPCWRKGGYFDCTPLSLVL